MSRATGQDRLDSMRARMVRKLAGHKAKMETESEMQKLMEKLSLERATRSMRKKSRRKNKSKQEHIASKGPENSGTEPTPLDDSFYLNIEQRAGCLRYDCAGDLCLDLMDPHKEFYLMPSLPSKRDYYQHLVVNNMSTLKNYSSTWSRDPVTDRQYVSFYSKLKGCIIDKVPSWREHVSGCLTSNKAKQKAFISNRRVYEKDALLIAKSTEFSKLDRKDVFQCILEVIKETSLVLERLKFSKEFHLCLLRCGYREEEEISDEYLSWEKREDHPLHIEFEMGDYENWLGQPGIHQMNKTKKEAELRKYHELKSKEDCSTRIRYLKLKLELAENLGLISKEAGTIQ